ncbi:MAG: AAA family ATPase, partial [Hymenobacter sp.]
MAQFQNDKEAADSLTRAYQQLRQEIGKVIVGQEEVVRLVLTAVFAQGHCLLVGVPGLAKTLLIQTIADSLDLSFNRIQ